MIKSIVLFFIFCCVLALAPFFVGEKGYVLIALGNYTIESSVIPMLVAALLIVFTGYWLLKGIAALSKTAVASASILKHNADRKQFAQLHAGLWAYLSNNHQQAIDMLSSLKDTDSVKGWQRLTDGFVIRSQLVNGEQQAARERYQQQDADFQHRLMPAFVATRDWEAVAKVFKDHPATHKSPIEAIESYLQWLIYKENWEQVIALLADLNVKQYAELIEKTLEQLLMTADSLEVLEQRYAQISRKLKPVAERFYIQAGIHLGHLVLVESNLIKMLKQQEYELLARYLRFLPGNCADFSVKFYDMVQQRLKKDPENRHLSVIFALLALENKQPDLAVKALHFLNEADHKELHFYWSIWAKALTQSGDKDKALALYQHFITY